MSIAILTASMNGKNVTVRITDAQPQGVAQRGGQGQSPTFVIESEPEAQAGNRLTVHAMDPQSFMIDVIRWQNFRILPTIGTDTVTQNISR